MTKGRAWIDDRGDEMRVGCEDLNVEAFGGGDYEVTYTLDRENRQRLLQALESEGLRGTAEEMIRAHFGECLDLDSFSAYCARRGIEYRLFTWVS